jgi:hypothetical protein
VKARTTLQLPATRSDEGCLNDPSVEAALHREILKLGEWLAAQGLDLQSDHSHADEGSRDGLYLRYGYFIGLKQALALLRGRGETIH